MRDLYNSNNISNPNTGFLVFLLQRLEKIEGEHNPGCVKRWEEDLFQLLLRFFCQLIF